MILQPLKDLQIEIQRLMMAGSRLAKSDALLQKSLPDLQKLGEKVPVIGKLAKSVEDLLKGNEAKAPQQVLEINLLINSIIQIHSVTSQQVDNKEELVPVVAMDSLLTDTRLIKETVMALNLKMQDRMGMVYDSFEKGAFADCRTYQYVNAALDKKFPDLVAYLMETVIPAIGKPMTPYLLDSLKFEPIATDVVRFKTLYNIGYNNMSELIEKVFAEKLPAHQAEAMLMLAEDEKNKERIYTFLKDKNRTLRLGAYRALCKMKKEDMLHLWEILKSGSDKPNTEALIELVGELKSMDFYDEVLQQAEEQFEEFIAPDKKFGAHEKLRLAILTLKNKEDKRSYDFFTKVLRTIGEECNSNPEMEGLSNNDVHHIEKLGTTIAECVASYTNVDAINDFYEEALFYMRPPAEGGMRYRIANETRKTLESKFSRFYEENIGQKQFDSVFADYYKISDVYNTNIYSSFLIKTRYTLEYIQGKYGEFFKDKNLNPRCADIFYEYIYDQRCVENRNIEYASSSSQLEMPLTLLHQIEPKHSPRFNEMLKTTLMRFDHGAPFYLQFMLERNVDGWEVAVQQAIERNEYGMDLAALINSDFPSKVLRSHAEKLMHLSTITGRDMLKNAFIALAKAIDEKGLDKAAPIEKKEVVEYNIPYNYPILINDSGINTLPINYKWDNEVATAFTQYSIEDIENKALWQKINSLDICTSWPLFVAVSEWIAFRLSKVVNNKDVHQRLEAAWAGVEIKHIANLEHKAWVSHKTEWHTQQVFLDIMRDMCFDYLGKKEEYNYKLYQLIELFKYITPKAESFDKWLDEVLSKIAKDKPNDVIFKSYLFQNVAYDARANKEELNTYINGLDYRFNPYLHSAYKVYMLNVEEGMKENKPYGEELNINLGSSHTLDFALSEHKRGNITLALELYKRAYEKYGHRVEYAVGDWSGGLNNNQKIEVFTCILSQFPDSKKADRYIAEAYAKRNTLEDDLLATEHILKAISIDPDAARARVGQDLVSKYTSKMYRSKDANNFEEVIKMASILIRLQPDNAIGYINRSSAYNELGDTEKAKADRDIIKTLDRKTALDICNKNMEDFYNKENYRETIALALLMIELDPTNYGAHSHLVSSYNCVGDTDSTKEYLDKVSTLNKGKDDTFYMQRAFYHRILGKWDDALADYKEVLKNYPNWEQLHISIAKAYIGKGDWAQARDVIQNIFDAKESNYEMLPLAYVDFAMGNAKVVKKNLKKLSSGHYLWKKDEKMLFAFLKYAAEIEMEENLKICQDYINAQEFLFPYPLQKIVEVATQNGHPDVETLANLAAKLNEPRYK